MGDPEQADIVEAIVRAVPGVADLHSGMFGEVATHLPGRKVLGVRLNDTTVEVHITAWSTRPVRDTAADVRAAIAEKMPSAWVDVTVEAVATAPAPDRD